MRFAPVLVLACASLVSFVACKKPEPAVVDAGAAPAAVVIDAAPTVLQALDTDAGEDAGLDAAVVHHGGPGLNTNQLRAKQCCAEIKKMAGTDPILSSIAVQCNAFAMQLGPTSGGSAPEFAQLRQLLKSSPKLPAICQGM